MAYPAPTSLSHIHSYLHAFIEHQLCVKSLPSTDSTVRTRTEEFPQSSHSAILVANGEVGHQKDVAEMTTGSLDCVHGGVPGASSFPVWEWEWEGGESA